MQALGGHRRETLSEIESHLMPEHTERPRAGAVVLAYAIGEDAIKQVVVLMHHRTLAGDRM